MKTKYTLVGMAIILFILDLIFAISNQTFIVIMLLLCTGLLINEIEKVRNKKWMYHTLKEDMINRLAEKHGEQFIDDVMETFGMPTNFMDKYQEYHYSESEQGMRSLTLKPEQRPIEQIQFLVDTILAVKNNIKSVTTNTHIGAILQDSPDFQIIPNDFNKTIVTEPLVFKAGTINKVELFVDPVLRWDNNIMVFKDKDGNEIETVEVDKKSIEYFI